MFILFIVRVYPNMIIPFILSLMPFAKSLDTNHQNIFTQTYFDELVSIRHAHPSTATKQRPVFLTAHGFGASPFEWKEFKDYVESHSNALVSNVFLGGHNAASDFRTSTYKDWAMPIQEEYQRLVNLGFESIILCGSSTGATLMLYLFNNDFFRPSLPIKHVIFIDPLVSVKQKLLYLMPVLKYFVSDIRLALTEAEFPHWIPIRPVSSLLQLLDLVNSISHALNRGISCPSHIPFSIFQSKYDPIINRQSIVDIYNGLKKLSPVTIDIDVVQSNKHVFTRLEGRENITPQDVDLQRRVFNVLISIADSIKP